MNLERALTSVLTSGEVIATSGLMNLAMCFHIRSRSSTVCHQQEAGCYPGGASRELEGGEGILILGSLHKEGPLMVLGFDMGDQVLMTMSARKMV